MWNRIATFMVVVTAMTLLFTPADVEGRRGGGGPRGGGPRGGGPRGGAGPRGGGQYRGGNHMNRTPTMNRAPNRSNLAQQRPQGARRQDLQQRPSVANRADLRNQVQNFAQNRPPQHAANRQDLRNKVQNLPSNRGDRLQGDRLQGDRLQRNRELSDRVSRDLRQSRPGMDQWFNQNFFDRHNLDVDYVGRGADLWRPAAWATLATWGSWRWSEPYYYDGGYVYPLSEGEYSVTTPTYAVQDTYTTDQSAPATADNWLPLGVFAVAANSEDAAASDRYMQLALNRSGEIAGVLYNSATDTAQDLTGIVESHNQMAYWSLDNQTDSPIASTGIFNLTEDETQINVHFADGSDQTWMLVRIQDAQ